MRSAARASSARFRYGVVANARCDGRTKETLSPSCANEWTELRRRQEALRLSNEEVNKDVNAHGVKTRGGLHGGGPWFHDNERVARKALSVAPRYYFLAD